jgi:hypothetical protein
VLGEVNGLCLLVLFFSVSRSEMLLSTSTSWCLCGLLVLVVCVWFGLQSGCATCCSGFAE